MTALHKLDAIGAARTVPDLLYTDCDAINKYQQVANQVSEGLGTRLEKRVTIECCGVCCLLIVYLVN